MDLIYVLCLILIPLTQLELKKKVDLQLIKKGVKTYGAGCILNFNIYVYVHTWAHGTVPLADQPLADQPL